MVFCKACGHEAKDGSKFCSNCGKEIVVVAEYRSNDLPSFSKVKAKEVASATKELADKPRGYGYQTGKQESTSTVWVPKEVDLSDADLKAAWKRVSSEKDKDNFLLFEFAGTQENKSNKITVAKVGDTGRSGLIKHLKANQGTVYFGVLLVVGTNVGAGVNVRRNKFVYFSFVGSAVPELIAAQVGPLKRQVEKFFGAVALALELRGTNLDDIFTANQLAFALDHGSGSHKCDKYDFGDGTIINSKDATSLEDNDSESEEDFD